MQIIVAKSAHDPRWCDRFATRRQGTHKAAAQPIAKMSVADREEVDRLLNSATKVSAKVRRAFLEAIDRLGQQIDVEKIKALLEQGRTGEAIASVDAQLVQGGFKPVTDAITAGAITAAQDAVRGLGELNISFGVTNPETISFLRTYEMGLIRGLTQDALGSVRTAITAGVSAGQNPLTVAREVKQFIGLTEAQTRAVVNFRALLEQGSKEALTRALRDKRFDPSVARALDNPLSSDQIDRMVQRYAERYIQYRAQTISRTEAMRAVNIGNHQVWKQAVADGKVSADQVKRKWVATHDGRTRHAHLTVDALNPNGVGLNEPFKTELGPLMFPGDPNGEPANVINCRCTVLTRLRH